MVAMLRAFAPKASKECKGQQTTSRVQKTRVEIPTTTTEQAASTPKQVPLCVYTNHGDKGHTVRKTSDLLIEIDTVQKLFPWRKDLKVADALQFEFVAETKDTLF